MTANNLDTLFVYGTLLNAEILQCLLGYQPARTEATIVGYQRFAVRDDVFPAVRAVDNKRVEGLLLHQLSVTDLALLDQFEGELYTRIETTALVNDSDVACYLYVLKKAYYHWLDDTDWCNQQFRRDTLDDYIAMLESGVG